MQIVVHQTCRNEALEAGRRALARHAQGAATAATTARTGAVDRRHRHADVVSDLWMFEDLFAMMKAQAEDYASRKLVPVLQQPVVYPPGGHIALHCDDSYLRDGEYVVHAAARKISAVLWLQDQVEADPGPDEFTGGDLVFPNHDLTVHPKAGMLALFPSSREFPHFTTPVTGSRARCALVAFYDWSAE